MVKRNIIGFSYERKRIHNMKDSLEFLIPVIISIIAIVFTGIQQNIANKQFLFDKRLYL